LGYTFSGSNDDAVYKLTFTFPHSVTSLGLVFSGSGLQAPSDESWGIDNIVVSATNAVYSNDFQGAVGPAWSNLTTDVTPSGKRFLGQFGNTAVILTLGSLPPHSEVTISFDLYVIHSWDGNDTSSGTDREGNTGPLGPDIWDLSIPGGPTLLHTTFSNQSGSSKRQAYPDPYPPGDNAGFTAADENNTLGYNDYYGDSVYRLSFTFSHSASSLALSFSASGLQKALSDESWGIDNVLAGIVAGATPTFTATPTQTRTSTPTITAAPTSPPTPSPTRTATLTPAAPLPLVIGGPLTNPANGHSYYLLSGATWTASEGAAAALGGHLVTINDAAEEDFVYSTFASYGGVNRVLWIGLTDVDSPGHFHWVSGERFTYTHWSFGEPNSPSEHYGQIFPPDDSSRHGLWNNAFDNAANPLDPTNGVVEILSVPTATVSPSAPATRTASPTPARIKVVYYALGDSVASGHGLIGGTGQIDGSCQRSLQAYPFRVAKKLGALPQYRVLFDDPTDLVREDPNSPFFDPNFAPEHDLACTGAQSCTSGTSSGSAADFACRGPDAKTPPLVDLPTEVRRLSNRIAHLPADEVVLVSLTIGADDFHFVDELISKGTNLCASGDLFFGWAAQTAFGLEAKLNSVIRTLLSRPNVYVVLTDYPNPLNPQSAYFDLLPSIARTERTCDTALLTCASCGLGSPLCAVCAAALAPCSALSIKFPVNRNCADISQGTLLARTSRVFKLLEIAIQNAYSTAHANPTLAPRIAMATVSSDFRGHESAQPYCGDAPPRLSETYVQSATLIPRDLDLRTLTAEQPQLLKLRYSGNDCFHPNEEGAEQYADRVFESAKQILP